MAFWRSRSEASGRVLGLVPLVVALVVGSVVLPRAVPPGDIPLPRFDGVELEKTERADDARAARKEPLAPEVRATGEAIRSFNAYEAHDDPDAPWADARASIDRAVAEVMAKDGIGAITELRAVQLGRFVDEVRAYSETGKLSAEMDALGGAFLRRMQAAGWLTGSRLALDPHALRVAFKLKWNATARLEDRPELALTLDEERSLYAFYLSHPHAPENARVALDAARHTAKAPQDCLALDEGERLAAERWRLDKIEKLIKRDPSYPADYAKGIGEYRAGFYDASARSFQAWLDGHPDGAYSLRARNYLRAAINMAAAER